MKIQTAKRQSDKQTQIIHPTPSAYAEMQVKKGKDIILTQYMYNSHELVSSKSVNCK